MKISKVSLGGQNNHGRMSGTRSSRVLSTIFKKLQKLDREISKLQNRITPFGDFDFGFEKHRNKKLEQQIKKLDLKRKEVRIERKKYNL
jgi:hypothetical protein